MKSGTIDALSKCCGALLVVRGEEDSPTNYYECTYCNEACDPQCLVCEKLRSQLAALKAAVQELVNAQAENPGLWTPSRSPVEAYLQQELRKLHHELETLIADDNQAGEKE